MKSASPKLLRQVIESELRNRLHDRTAGEILQLVDQLVSFSVQEASVELQEQVNTWCDIAMKSEALRDKVMLDGILGKFKVAEPKVVEEYKNDCGSCLGYGHFDKDGKSSLDKRDRKCLDCNGSGEAPSH